MQNICVQFVVGLRKWFAPRRNSDKNELAVAAKII